MSDVVLIALTAEGQHSVQQSEQMAVPQSAHFSHGMLATGHSYVAFT